MGSLAQCGKNFFRQGLMQYNAHFVQYMFITNPTFMFCDFLLEIFPMSLQHVSLYSLPLTHPFPCRFPPASHLHLLCSYLYQSCSCSLFHPRPLVTLLHWLELPFLDKLVLFCVWSCSKVSLLYLLLFFRF